MIENGVYKLKQRIENPCPYTREESWIACATIPPGEEDDFYWELDSFLLVVQDRPILGRMYKEITLGNGGWRSGFFVGEIPKDEDFSDFSQGMIEDEVHGSFQFMSPEPAPKELLDALVPVKGQSLEEVLLMFGQDPDLDPQLRLDKSFWASTVFEVMRKLCSAHPDVLNRFTGGLRRLLKEDAHRKNDFTYPDPKMTEEHRKRENERVEARVEKQWRAFRKLDEDRRRK